MARAILIGLAGGLLIALLEVLEYKHLVLASPTSWYGGLVAAIFSAVGLVIGLRWTRARQAAIVPEPPAVAAPAAPANSPFVPDAAEVRRLGLTPREHEILGLVADGLSNREIAGRLHVSENTVKTHCSRVFDKLAVNRRVQAVRRGRELRLIP